MDLCYVCRVYDTIIDNRFKKWYTPNPEQSSQSKQGCPLPLFTLNLLIDFADETNRGIFVGFLDFEKAYDYVNRAKLLLKLMKDGCGKKFVHAVANMYGESTYAPKLNESQLGNRITTNHGVTQGRKSSGNFFAYYIADMAESVRNVNTTDFLDPYNLLQLADDTTLLAEYFLLAEYIFKRNSSSLFSIRKLSTKSQMSKRLSMHTLRKNQHPHRLKLMIKRKFSALTIKVTIFSGLFIFLPTT